MQPLATPPRYFNPRPPCGGRLISGAGNFPAAKFQSTSSVWRTTAYAYAVEGGYTDFNPRPPCGGRPHLRTGQLAGQRISIHVLRVEDDCKHAKHAQFCALFQSTSSVWRTTHPTPLLKRVVLISIHVLRVEDDGRAVNQKPHTSVFQSTSSVWRTTGPL